MAIIGLFAPFNMEGAIGNGDTVLTVVTPGPCPLNCSFCGIRQRGERTVDAALSPSAYKKSILDLAQTGRLIGASVVGDEPLAEAGWPTTWEFLDTARSLGVPSAIITSGYNLAERVNELTDAGPTTLVVSLDGAADVHDRIRGVPGTFGRAIHGIKELRSRSSSAQDGLVVASVARPKNVSDLYELLDTLKRLKVARWVISPLLVIGRQDCPPRTALRLSDFEELILLTERALDVGIDTYIDGDFRFWEMMNLPSDIVGRLRIRSLDKPIRIARMLPSGSVSIDGELLSKERNRRNWNGREDFSKFLSAA